MAGAKARERAGAGRQGKEHPMQKLPLPYFRIPALWAVGLAALFMAGINAADLTREQALKAIERPEASQRLVGVERLAEVGRFADADRLLPHLADADERVRTATHDAVWQIWSRSCDPAIDK